MSQYLQTISGLWKKVCITEDEVNLILYMSVMTLQTKLTLMALLL